MATTGDSASAGPPGGPDFRLTRIFDAPRGAVFAAWTDPEQSAHWWGPRGYVTISCDMDVRPGGVWHRRMRAPDGSEQSKHGVYREVVAPERLVFTYVTDDDAGNPGPETTVTVTFEDLGDKTRLTLHQTGFTSVAARDEHEAGWTGSLGRCAEYLANS